MNFIGFLRQRAVYSGQYNVCLSHHCRTRCLNAVTPVRAANLRSGVLTVRLQRKRWLELIVGHRGNSGNVKANALPYRTRDVFHTNGFGCSVYPAVITVLPRGIFTIFQPGSRRLQVVLTSGASSFNQLLTSGGTAKLLRRKAGRNAGAHQPNASSRCDIFLNCFKSANDPRTNNRRVTCRRHLLITCHVKGAIRSLINVERACVFHLTTVSATPRDPATVNINAIIRVSIAAGRAFAAGDLRVRDRAITKLCQLGFNARLLCSTRRFISCHGSKCNTQCASVLCVRIANTCTARYRPRGDVAYVFRCQCQFLGRSRLSIFGVDVYRRGVYFFRLSLLGTGLPRDGDHYNHRIRQVCAIHRKSAGRVINSHGHFIQGAVSLDARRGDRPKLNLRGKVICKGKVIHGHRNHHARARLARHVREAIRPHPQRGGGHSR